MKIPPFQIQFGAISPAIKTQIKSQGLTAPNNEIARWQRLADAITLLKIQGIITGPQTIAARHRLIRKMDKFIKAK